jgi:methionyl aminopeptidase
MPPSQRSSTKGMPHAGLLRRRFRAPGAWCRRTARCLSCSRHLAQESHRLLVLDQGLFEVDDVDLVAMAEDEGSHLGVPETGLVTEMDTRLQHLTHGRRHQNLRYGLASARPCNPVSGHPFGAGRAYFAGFKRQQARIIAVFPLCSSSIIRSFFKMPMYRSPTEMSHHHQNPREIDKMRIAGRLAGEVLDYITPFVKPGVTTGELDRLCHDYMVNVQGCIPAPLNYAPPGHAPYPKSICTSVNHQVCHGVPGEKKLKNGDVVNLDITVIKDGWHGDTSRMFIRRRTLHPGPAVHGNHLRVHVAGHRRGRAGAKLGDIGAAIQKHAESATAFRWCANSAATASAASSTRNPRCCTTARPGTGPDCRPGMIFTIEPMINAGKARSATGRRLDHRHQGPQPVGPVGAHRAGHRNRPASRWDPDPVRR